MKLEPVESSNIKGIGYDPATREMRVQFLSGALHSYQDVPAHVHAAFAASDSKGKHFHVNIKNGGFKSGKVDTDAAPGA